MIDYRFYYFGPHLFHTKLNTFFCNKMLEFKSTSAVKNLAGHFEHEYYITKDGQEHFMNHLQNTGVIPAFKESFKNFYGDEVPGDLKLDTMWINYMSAGDFNPWHGHSHDLSFVFFVKTDEKILEENKNHKGADKDLGPGALTFSWGEPQDGIIQYKSFLPNEGDLLIFPAKLRHMVYPFKSNVERISISGNLRYGKV
tara:strand:- start:68 stop:661 length:594 start_codon:yes stop_codon:yes gene_type:complete